VRAGGEAFGHVAAAEWREGEAEKTHLAADVLLLELLLQAARKSGILIDVLLLAQRQHTVVEQHFNTPQSLCQIA